MNHKQRKETSSVLSPCFRELMVGVNQHKDKHELQSWSFFLVVKRNLHPVLTRSDSLLKLKWRSTARKSPISSTNTPRRNED
jgi:hypothetical protein